MGKNASFLAAIILSALVLRIYSAYVFVDYPSLPHDMCAYVGAAEFLLEGKPLYESDICNIDGLHFTYGPLTALVFAGWAWAFGKGYFAMKFPSIIFEMLTILAVFKLSKRIAGEESARYAAAFYAFSWLPLMSSGLLGNNDELFVLFIPLSLYLLISKRFVPAAVSLAVGVGFEGVTMLIIPPAAYYIYRCAGFRKMATSGIAGAVTLLLMLLTFQYLFPTNILYSYGGAISFQPVMMLSPLNAVKQSVSFLRNAADLATTGSIPPFESNPISFEGDAYNVFFNRISGYVLIAGYLLAALYMHRFRLKNRELELIRNCFVMVLSGYLFFRFVTDLYILWIMPLLFTAIVAWERKNYGKFRLTKEEAHGILLVAASYVLFAHTYRETYLLPAANKVVLLALPLSVAYGTYLMLSRSSLRNAWSLLMLGCMIFVVSVTVPVLPFMELFSGYIAGTPFAQGTYLITALSYVGWYLSTLVATAGFLLLSSAFHRLTRRVDK